MSPPLGIPVERGACGAEMRFRAGERLGSIYVSRNPPKHGTCTAPPGPVHGSEKDPHRLLLHGPNDRSFWIYQTEERRLFLINDPDFNSTAPDCERIAKREAEQSEQANLADLVNTLKQHAGQERVDAAYAMFRRREIEKGRDPSSPLTEAQLTDLINTLKLHMPQGSVDAAYAKYGGRVPRAATREAIL